MRRLGGDREAIGRRLGGDWTRLRGDWDAIGRLGGDWEAIAREISRRHTRLDAAEDAEEAAGDHLDDNVLAAQGLFHDNLDLRSGGDRESSRMADGWQTKITRMALGRQSGRQSERQPAWQAHRVVERLEDGDDEGAEGDGAEVVEHRALQADERDGLAARNAFGGRVGVEVPRGNDVARCHVRDVEEDLRRRRCASSGRSAGELGRGDRVGSGPVHLVAPEGSRGISRTHLVAPAGDDLIESEAIRSHQDQSGGNHTLWPQKKTMSIPKRMPTAVPPSTVCVSLPAE